MAIARCALFAGMTVLCFAGPGLAQDHSELVEQGKRLFFTHGCYGCHTVGKVGTPIGPNLSHVGAQYELSYLTGWLRDPASQKPTAHMPKIDLKEQEIQALAGVPLLTSVRAGEAHVIMKALVMSGS